MKILFAVIFSLTLQYTAHAQHLDRQQLDNHLKKTDSTALQENRNIVYVINGTPFNRADSLQLDAALLSFSINHLTGLEVLTCAALSLPHCNSLVVLIHFAYRQSLKEKQLLWKKVHQAFRDKYISFSEHILTDAKDPVLYIDNVKIHHTEATEKLKTLSPHRIYYIGFNDQPQPATLYGQNAKNGLVSIWTLSK